MNKLSNVGITIIAVSHQPIVLAVVGNPYKLDKGKLVSQIKKEVA